MRVQAEISVYPLRTSKLSGPVGAFCDVLRSHGLDVQTRSMSTLTTGESSALLAGLREGFERLAQQNDIVMDVKISNACPARMGQDARIERVD